MLKRFLKKDMPRAKNHFVSVQPKQTHVTLNLKFKYLNTIFYLRHLRIHKTVFFMFNIDSGIALFSNEYFAFQPSWFAISYSL